MNVGNCINLFICIALVIGGAYWGGDGLQTLAIKQAILFLGALYLASSINRIPKCIGVWVAIASGFLMIQLVVNPQPAARVLPTGELLAFMLWYLYTLSQPKPSSMAMSWFFFGMALVQTGLLWLGFWTGTLGNTDFLATVLAVGFLLGLNVFTQNTPIKWQWWGTLISLMAILLGLIMTHSKGTLLFIGVVFFYKLACKKHMGRIFLAGLPLVLVGVCFIPAMAFSLKGRLFLWLIGWDIMASAPFFGVGLGAYAGHYMGSITNLYQQWPSLSSMVGTYPGYVINGHNILLHYGAELGILGAVLVAALLWHGGNLCRKQFGSNAAWCLILLLVKSMYTVVVTSISGGVLLAFFMAFMNQRPVKSIILPTNHLTMLMKGAAMLAMVVSMGFMLPDMFQRRAQQQLVAGNVDQATKLYGWALAMNPHHSHSLLGMAMVSFSHVDIPKMSVYLDRAFLAEPSINVVKPSAELYYRAGDMNRAYFLYEQVHKAYIEHLSPLTRMASIAVHRGDIQLAIQLSRQVLLIEPRVKSDTYKKNKAFAQFIMETYNK